MIIAELCQNHLGDAELLKKMVDRAKEAGAWGAKIQTFFADDLNPSWAPLSGLSHEEEKERLRKLELNWDVHRQFVKWCEEVQIVPITSVYTFKYAEILASMGFRHIKIGSAQAMDEALIRRHIVVGFKVMVSTGGSDLSKLPRMSGLECVFHCVSQYPTPQGSHNLTRMLSIPKYYPRTNFGLSAHPDTSEIGWDTPIRVASFLGAKYTELHYTEKERSETKDGKVSLRFEELKDICAFDALAQSTKRELLPSYQFLLDQSVRDSDLVKHFSNRWSKDE